MSRRLILVPALVAAVAVIPLLFAEWFELGGNYLVLFGALDRLNFRPTGWEAFGWQDIALAVLAMGVLAATIAALRGWSRAGVAGVLAAIAGVFHSLIAAANPPAPPFSGPADGVIGGLPELAATPAAYVTAGCFGLALASLACYLLISRVG